MRTCIAAVCMLLMLTETHCKKDKLKALQGSWKLAYYDGGFVGRRMYPNPGELTILKFNDSTAEKYAHDTLLSKGTFRIGAEMDNSVNKQVPYIYCEEIANGAINIVADTLSIYDINIADGRSSHYIRYKE